MKNKRRLSIILALLVFATAARADQIDVYIKAEMTKQRIPGVSIAIIRNGSEMVKARGYGLANVELGVAASPDTVYRIGSVSKQFLAAGIMLLVEEGKLRLDDSITKYLEGSPELWKTITIRHLLSHTSGLVREAPGFNPLKIQSDLDVIKTAYSLPLRFPVGEKWEYSNLGYFALAEIISKASGKAWGDYMRERVFKPLGMNSTRVIDMKEIVSNRASGYAWKDNRMENADTLLALRPSGAFLSTAMDMARWDTALYTDKILKQSSRDEMWKPVMETSRKTIDGATQSYGLGWFIAQMNGHRAIFHGGAQPGFRAEFTRFIDDKLTVVVLTNADGARPDVIARGIAGFYIPDLAVKEKAQSAK